MEDRIKARRKADHFTRLANKATTKVWNTRKPEDFKKAMQAHERAAKEWEDIQKIYPNNVASSHRRIAVELKKGIV